jgi:hypothetical protein
MDLKIPEKMNLGAMILYIINNQVYKTSLVDIVKLSISKFKNICFIALTSPHDTLSSDFIKSGIDVSKIFFIDAISKNTKTNLKVLPLPSPQALLEMDTGIDEMIVGGGAQCFILDSLSSLLAYGDSLTLSKFINMITQKIKESNTCGVFICLDKDISSNLINDISMFSDEVIRV